MAFGFFIKTPQGKEIIYGAEEAYLYWGKVNVTRNQSSGTQETAMFNIPESWKPMVFIASYNRSQSTLTAGYSSAAFTTFKNGRLHLKTVHNVQGSVSYECLVFVPARYVPTPKYGMALYNKNNILAFHNGRYPLVIAELLRPMGAIGSRGYYPAVESTLYDISVIPDYVQNVGAVYATYLVGEGQGFFGDNMLVSYGGSMNPYFPDIGNLAVAAINRNPYNSLPNLGNAP